MGELSAMGYPIYIWGLSLLITVNFILTIRILIHSSATIPPQLSGSKNQLPVHLKNDAIHHDILIKPRSPTATNRPTDSASDGDKTRDEPLMYIHPDDLKHMKNPNVSDPKVGIAVPVVDTTTDPTSSTSQVCTLVALISIIVIFLVKARRKALKNKRMKDALANDFIYEFTPSNLVSSEIEYASFMPRRSEHFDKFDI
jgi:hypothetical protein